MNAENARGYYTQQEIAVAVSVCRFRSYRFLSVAEQFIRSYRSQARSCAHRGLRAKMSA